MMRAFRGGKRLLTATLTARDLADANGQPFKNEDDCVSFIVRGGTPTPREGIIFAIAYSDLNGTQGYQAGTADVLISKFVDGNHDGTPDAGDLVIMGRYPTTLTPTGPADFAAFGVTSHTVLAVGFGSGACSWGVETDAGLHDWSDLRDCQETTASVRGSRCRGRSE